MKLNLRQRVAHCPRRKKIVAFLGRHKLAASIATAVSAAVGFAALRGRKNEE